MCTCSGVRTPDCVCTITCPSFGHTDARGPRLCCYRVPVPSPCPVVCTALLTSLGHCLLPIPSSASSWTSSRTTGPHCGIEQWKLADRQEITNSRSRQTQDQAGWRKLRFRSPAKPSWVPFRVHSQTLPNLLTKNLAARSQFRTQLPCANCKPGVLCAGHSQMPQTCHQRYL